MIIDCIADLHGHYPKLEGGDLLIVAGDWTRNDSEENLRVFEGWLLGEGCSKYKEIIVIAGNHDNTAYEFKNYGLTPHLQILPAVKYLCDSGTEFQGFKIWGSPWTSTFPGMNPHCNAFTFDTERELEKKWDLIPDDTQILITHSPGWNIHDRIKNPHDGEDSRKGSFSLCERIINLKNLRLHVCGHIHEGYGELQFYVPDRDYNNTFLVNASHVNEHYEPVNAPIRIDTNSRFDKKYL